MREVNIFVCSFCKKSFDSNDAVACHLLNAHDSDKTIKKVKKQLKSRKQPLVRSSKTTNGKSTKLLTKQIRRDYKKEFYCDICNYKTVHLSTYKRHLLRHEKDGRQHKCMYCSYTAIQSNNLKIHLETVHPFGAVEPVIVDEDYLENFQEKYS